MKMHTIHPYPIYRNAKGWPRWYQPFLEAWWVATKKWSLHRIMQFGLDEGHRSEYKRLITNGAWYGELGLKLRRPKEVDRAIQTLCFNLEGRYGKPSGDAWVTVQRYITKLEAASALAQPASGGGE